jgi:hypothetical protein
MFKKTFTNYGDMPAISFLSLCIPPSYRQFISNKTTLKDALAALAKWISDSKIHTETLVQALKAIPTSDLLTGDRIILRNQIVNFQRCIDIDESFFLEIASIQIHISKYFDTSLYHKTMDILKKCATNNKDPKGRRNYTDPFMLTLEDNYRYIEDRLNCNTVNNYAIARHMALTSNNSCTLEELQVSNVQWQPYPQTPNNDKVNTQQNDDKSNNSAPWTH